MRLRVGGGTSQALSRAVKQPTTTNAGQLVGPELAQSFAVAHEVEHSSGVVKVQARVPSVKRAGRVWHHACLWRECCVEVGGQRRRAIEAGMVGDIAVRAQCRNIFWIRVVPSQIICARREGY